MIGPKNSRAMSCIGLTGSLATLSCDSSPNIASDAQSGDEWMTLLRCEQMLCDDPPDNECVDDETPSAAGRPQPKSEFFAARKEFRQ